MAVAAVVAAGVVAAARVEVAAVVVVTMAVVLVSPLTLYRPSATVLFYFVLKPIFYENKKKLKNSQLGNRWPESALVCIKRSEIIESTYPVRIPNGENLNFKGYKKKKMDPSQIFA